MNILEEIKNMKKQGKNDDEIVEALKAKRVSDQQIDDAFSQLQIRNAIVEEEPQEETSAPSPSQPATQEIDAPPQDYAPPYEEEPQQEEQPQEQPQEQAPGVYAEAPQQYQQYQQPQYPQYQQVQQPQPSQQFSSDTISEIAEQIIAEKLSPIRDRLEKTLDLKTTLEAKTEALDERLKRIEQIIDRLQLSILQRIGSYMNEVDNVKKELNETQKSFKAVSKKSQPKQFSKE